MKADSHCMTCFLRHMRLFRRLRARKEAETDPRSSVKNFDLRCLHCAESAVVQTKVTYLCSNKVLNSRSRKSIKEPRENILQLGSKKHLARIWEFGIWALPTWQSAVCLPSFHRTSPDYDT